jgi:DNA-nicking Smr family endonuclease
VGKKPFNDAFSKLRDRPKAEPPAPERPVAPSTGPRTGPEQPLIPGAGPRSGPESREATEAELWARELSGVRPLDPGPGTVAPPPPPPPPERFWHPDLDAIDELKALVNGDGPFDLADTDEFIEGRAPGIDVGLVRKLRRGDFAVQGHVDLHGLTREEAKATVEAYLRDARSAGKRCVLVVHGRGLHSKDQLPVLKDALRTWLSTNRFARHVLAFATARPVDGGAGAIYVLLRRAGR